MPGQWTSIETNFPSFTGNEPVKDQLKQMYNYMYILTEQLKYNLSNLNTTNFNATALEKLTMDTSSEAASLIAEDIEKINSLYTQLNARVSSLSNTVAGLLGRMATAEAETTALSERMGLAEYALGAEGDIQNRIYQLETDVPMLEQLVSGEGGLEDRMQAAEDSLADMQAQNDDTDARLGSAEESLEKLSEAVAVEEGAVTVGGEDRTLHLVGQIYINGVLFEPNQNTEQEEDI